MQRPQAVKRRQAGTLPRLRLGLDRVLLVPRLSLRVRLRRSRRAFAVLYAVDCQREEEQELNEIDQAMLLHLADVARQGLGGSASLPTIRIFCLGRHVRWASLPSSIRRAFERNMPCGKWLRSLRVGLVRCQQAYSVRHAVAHEAAHGLMDLMTGGFDYLPALEEGFASHVAHAICTKGRRYRTTGRSHDPSASVAQRPTVLKSRFMSLHETLAFRPSCQTDKAMLYRFVVMSAWLYSYVRLLSIRRPRLRRLLIEARIRNLTNPHEVFDWLQEVTGWTMADLEKGFRYYCLREKQENVSWQEDGQENVSDLSGE